MANSSQAAKRARQDRVKGRRNAAQRSQVRTAIKRVIAAVAADDVEQAKAAFRRAESVIDRMAGKGILSKNKAARHKRRLNVRVKRMGASAEA